jgi:plastocyanin
MKTTVTACAAFALIAAASSLAACSNDSSGAMQDGPQVVTVHVTDRLTFEPSTVQVHLGTVRFTLIDDGSYPHNLVARAAGVEVPTVNGDPGEQSVTMLLHFTKPGRVPFVCTYHASAGMRGTFLVSP